MQVQRKRKPSGIVIVVKPLLVPKPTSLKLCEPSPACLHPLPCWAILGCERLTEVLEIEEMQHYDG